uniref:Reverse transcriptase zinc-binding domain-containing protein n=1 Tax=Lactuca sativa TaxID=4236 RepID=A0A9R1WXF7_LACSA|nr:hypothetical protein LSAT_V11C800431320 [Lactuca sativa]
MKSNPSSISQIHEIMELTEKLELHPRYRQDRLTCGIFGDGTYYVNVLREKSIGQRQNLKTATLNSILTACALQKRGINLSSVICKYCEIEEEDNNHAIIQCLTAATVWEWVFRWCGIPQPTDLVKFWSQWGRYPKRRKTLISICYGVAWLIWKARCDLIFKENRITPTKVVDNVKAMVFTWIKHRRSNCSYVWLDWCNNPFSC